MSIGEQVATLPEAWPVVVLVGIGTFLLRLLPFVLRVAGAHPRWLMRLARGLGPAALLALLCAALMPGFAPTAGKTTANWPSFVSHVMPHLAGIAAACAAIATARRIASGIALPTLAGALAYGLVHAFLAAG